jgi:PhnB protein
MEHRALLEDQDGAVVDVPPSIVAGVSPHLVVSDAPRAARFYCRAFGAVELYRLCARQGKIARVELQLGEGRLTLSDESPEWGTRSARSQGGSPVSLQIQTLDVEALARSFLGAGGFMVQPLREQPHGDRSGQFRDPEGYHWSLAQRIEEVSPEQFERRMSAIGLSLWWPRTGGGERPRGPRR